MPHLIHGRDYLSRYEGFRLIGRDNDLRRISSILTRKRANSLLLVGPGGVGCTALCLGLQAAKAFPETPFDIVSKRLFWLDVDRLFASGDPAAIDEGFKRSLGALARTPESVLIVENARAFIEASRATGAGHFVNALILAVKSGKTQVIFETRDDDLEHVLRWHGEVAEAFTLYDLKEPVGAFLEEIVRGVSAELSKHHGGIRVSDDAIRAAIEITTKYRSAEGIAHAQPARTVELIDRALSSYRLEAHRNHPQAEAMEAIKAAYRRQRDAEGAVLELEAELDAQLKRDAERKAAGEDERSDYVSFAALAGGAFESKEAQAIRARIREHTQAGEANRTEYERLTAAINAELELSRAAVLQEFSEISGVPVAKLGEDEMANLRNLEGSLAARVFGQDAAVRHIADSVKVAKIAGADSEGPAATYLLLGPSGVGKTEIAKALAASVIGDEKALVRFDMSEYMEKHAVAKLIGAPPGYEGFEVGGILTNSVRRTPVGVYLFDEIEKAHPDVFNVFLQILSDGRLTDNVGRVVSFRDIFIVMTSNIGQPHFLNMGIGFDEAKARAREELDQTYRSEFLNRFNGRENILYFNRLELDSIERIVRREIDKVNAAYAGRGLRVELDDAHLSAFCRDNYDARMGARGLPGYIKANLQPIIVNQILATPDATGAFRVEYDEGKRGFAVRFEEAALAL